MAAEVSVAARVGERAAGRAAGWAGRRADAAAGAAAATEVVAEVVSVGWAAVRATEAVGGGLLGATAALVVAWGVVLAAAVVGMGCLAGKAAGWASSRAVRVTEEAATTVAVEAAAVQAKRCGQIRPRIALAAAAAALVGASLREWRRSPASSRRDRALRHEIMLPSSTNPTPLLQVLLENEFP